MPVVDHLEVVEVHQQQREARAVVVRQRRVEPLHEQRAVREPGQGVVVGLVGQPVGELAAVADVVQGQHRALERAPVELPDGGDLEPAPAAVGAAQPALHEAVAALALEHRPDRVEGAAPVVGVHLRLQVGGVREPLPVAQRGVRGGAGVADRPVDADDDDDVGEVGHQVLPPLVAVQQLRRTTLHGRAQVAGEPQVVGDDQELPDGDREGQRPGQPEVPARVVDRGGGGEVGPGGQRERGVGQQLLGQGRRPAEVVLDRQLGVGGRDLRGQGDQQEAGQPAEVGHPAGAEGAGEGLGDVAAVGHREHQQAHAQRGPDAQPGLRQHHAADQHEGRDQHVGERVGEGVQPDQRLVGGVHDGAEHPQRR